MKPIIKKQEENTILTSEITCKHLVVAVISGNPCILTKGYYEPNEKLSFQTINSFDNRGNGYDYSYSENTEQKMVEEAMKNTKNKVAVFEQSDWKQALQWLIDNA